MKRFVLVLLAAIVCSAVLFMTVVYLLKPNYKFEYFHSPNKSETVTRIDYNGSTYFTYGFHDGDNIPDNYIQPVYSGLNSGFEVILFWEGDTAVIYSHYGHFNERSPGAKLQLRMYKGVGNDPLFYKMKNDTSGRYRVIQDAD